MTEEFKKIIDEDITKCDEQLQSGNMESQSKLHGMLISKYGNIIDGFRDGLHNLFYDNDGKYQKDNIERMKGKLLLFKAMSTKIFMQKVNPESQLITPTK